MKRIKLTMDASPGSDRDDCMREAIAIAIREDIKVEYEFNEQLVKVNPQTIMAYVKQNNQRVI